MYDLYRGFASCGTIVCVSNLIHISDTSTFVIMSVPETH